MTNYYLGVDIGGTFIKLGIVDSAGRVLKKDKIASINDMPQILANLETYLKEHQQYLKISGVGISLPGVIHHDGTMQTAGSLKNLIGLNVKNIAQEHLKLPVEIITDSKAVALAEGWLGNGIEYANYVCVTLGSAIGGAIVIDRKLYWGRGGLAGEFGVSLMARDHEEYKLDSTSLHAGVIGGLCRKYSLAVGEEVKDAALIFDLAAQKDSLAEKYVAEFLDDVARMLVNISVYIAPEAILLGGGISANQMIMAKIQAAYQKIIKDYQVLSSVQMPEVIPCKLANDAGVIGSVKQIIDIQTRGE
ncbi:ROK family protein [Erwinia sp. CPCC 100877]|nr:ROK family protein [Erwinia sp. CPCC 100877]